MTDTRYMVRWYMQLPTHRQIRVNVRLGYNDYCSLKSDIENTKNFMRWIKENDKLDLIIEISKDPESDDNIIHQRVREKRLNKILE